MNMCSPQAQLVFRNAIAFDAADNVFNAHTYPRYCTVLFLFFIRQFAVFWFLFGLLDDHISNAKSLKAHILINNAAHRKGIAHVIGQSFIMPFPFIRGTEKTNTTIMLNNQNILDTMALFLSTIIQMLLIIIPWPIYWSLTAVMDKRGASFSGVCSSVSADSCVTAVRSGRQPAHSRAPFRMGCNR